MGKDEVEYDNDLRKLSGCQLECSYLESIYQDNQNRKMNDDSRDWYGSSLKARVQELTTLKAFLGESANSTFSFFKATTVS
eukprot:m.435813 g.435813  ORF g.435813 m.435813 type:complete len:81 (+) comp17897_c0_seq1:63-305(+)